MPTYVMHCRVCNEPFERFSWAEQGEYKPVCPKCNSPNIAIDWTVEEFNENLAAWGCG